MNFNFPCSNDDLNKLTDEQAYKYIEDVLQTMDRLHIISSRIAALARRAIKESKRLEQDTGINRGGKDKERFAIRILRGILEYWEGKTDLLSYRA